MVEVKKEDIDKKPKKVKKEEEVKKEEGVEDEDEEMTSGEDDDVQGTRQSAGKRPNRAQSGRYRAL